MKLTDIICGDKPSLSFEVFPPKNDGNYESVQASVEEIAALKPSYMSVTYGAGGGTSQFTGKIAADVQNRFGVPALAHLSCVSSTKEGVKRQLDELKAAGVENILALRGDLPDGVFPEKHDYTYSYELIKDIKAYGGFCIGAACYPESHPESETAVLDISYLKHKQECGCEFLTTQMFFDNNILYNFLYRLREAGVTLPVVAGVMPVTNPKSIKRICAISGTALPERFKRIVDCYGSDPAAMTQAGIAYATAQVIDLFANGVNAVHIYSMNKPEVARAIQNNLSTIIK